jgi:hypothetical protein
MSSQDDYELLDSQVIFEGRIITLRRDEVRMTDGRTAIREVVDHPGAGLEADEWHVLLDLHTSPGFTNEAIRLYLARGLHEVPDKDGFEPHSEELTLTVTREPLAEAVRRAGAGIITNATAVAGLLAAIHGRATGWRDLRPADAPWPARPNR